MTVPPPRPPGIGSGRGGPSRDEGPEGLVPPFRMPARNHEHGRERERQKDNLSKHESLRGQLLKALQDENETKAGLIEEQLKALEQQMGAAAKKLIGLLKMLDGLKASLLAAKAEKDSELASEIEDKIKALEEKIAEEKGLFTKKKGLEEIQEPTKAGLNLGLADMGFTFKTGHPADAIAKAGEKITPMAAKENVRLACNLIEKMCSTALVGDVGGKPGIMMDLKRSPEVPSFFQGTSLTIVQQDQGLSVRFTNFQNAEQERMAIYAVQQNAEALRNLVGNLYEKNMTIFEIQIGSLRIEVPPPVSLEKPVETAPPAEEPFPERDRGGREREGQRDEGGRGREER